MKQGHTPGRIIELGEPEIVGLRRAWGITRIVVELAEDGGVARELGYDDLGRLIHRWPEGRAKYGLLDLATFDTSTRTEMTQEQFKRLWEGAIEEEAFFAEHDPYDDRFGSSIPWWGCLGALILVAALAYIAIF